jgi:peptidoglycan/LPS O-acetylase OafA/YrhL
MPSQRSIGLDLLRCLAVLMVIVSHLDMEPIPAARMPYLIQVLKYGAAGVTLFFVLSGFLVSGLLFNEYKQRGNISIKRFYIRRAWKIYPAFYFFLAATYLYSRFVVGHKIPDHLMVREIFLYQNYLPGDWNHTWSLAVEEHFYCILPLILLFMAKWGGDRNPFTRLPFLVLTISTLALALRCVTCYAWPTYTYHTHCFPTHLRIDGLFFGVLIAYYYHFHSDTFRNALHRWRYILIGAGAAGLVSLRFVPSSLWFLYTFWPLQEYLSAGAILCGVVLCAIPRNTLTRSLATIGSYSYSIYLWHMATIYFVTPRLRDSVSWDIRAAIYLIGAFVGGIAMANLLELPVLKLRDRWFPDQHRTNRSGLHFNTASEQAPQMAA